MSADYFRTFGVAVLEGREFTAADHTDSPLVAMVNRTLAERLWPDRLAVGQVLTFPRSGGDRTVIRVAIGAREASLRWMVLAEGLRLVAVGALVGLAAAVPLTRRSRASSTASPPMMPPRSPAGYSGCSRPPLSPATCQRAGPHISIPPRRSVVSEPLPEFIGDSPRRRTRG